MDEMRGESAEGAFLAEHPPIPGYKPVRLLGQNSGTIYLVHRMSDRKEVILKVYHRQHYTEHQRVLDDLRLHLDHPHILRIFEIGEVKGHFYVVAEYVEGSLNDKLQHGPLTARDSAILAQALTLAIEYARDHGLVALKLIPSSVMFSRDKVPKLVDFELRDVAENSDYKDRFYSFYTSPAFMAPEVCAGDFSITEAADIYRIGAIMYAMLTGSPPFSGNTAVEILNGVLNRSPAYPRQLNSAVPKDLEGICLKCLEKQPKRRYSSLRNLANELGRFVSLC